MTIEDSRVAGLAVWGILLPVLDQINGYNAIMNLIPREGRSRYLSFDGKVYFVIERTLFSYLDVSILLSINISIGNVNICVSQVTPDK